MPQGATPARRRLPLPGFARRLARSPARLIASAVAVAFIFLAGIPYIADVNGPGDAHIDLYSDGLAWGFPAAPDGGAPAPLTPGLPSVGLPSASALPSSTGVPQPSGQALPGEDSAVDAEPSSAGDAPTPAPSSDDAIPATVPSSALVLEVLAPGAKATYLDGTRVLAPGPDASAQVVRALEAAAAEANAWLNGGVVPGADGPYEAMARGALLDLRALTGPDGALVAAQYPRWAYAWPRDNSFSAVAFARTGHLDEATAILNFLDRAQGPNGSFEARYLLDGSGPPDDRAPQTDGTGWTLWALGQVVDAAPEAERAAILSQFAGLLDRSTSFALAQMDNPGSLPAPSPDYWEVRERALTLGTAAPLLAGLESAAHLYELASAHDGAAGSGLADEAADGALRLRAAIEATFGPRGYPRHATGGKRDTATAFIMAPFVSEPLVGAAEAWLASIPGMERPAGGLAPGGSWKSDGISWTPETAIYALSAAHQGDVERARGWLTWLDGHRTASGALPEKVLADGSPAAVAPLAWTNAVVLLTLLDLPGD